MIPGRIEGAQIDLKAPVDWQADGPDCAGLPVRLDLADGLPVLRSAWLPTPEEIARIVAGAPVLLGIVGDRHPAVSMGVGDPPPAGAVG